MCVSPLHLGFTSSNCLAICIFFNWWGWCKEKIFLYQFLLKIECSGSWLGQISFGAEKRVTACTAETRWLVQIHDEKRYLSTKVFISMHSFHRRMEYIIDISFPSFWGGVECRDGERVENGREDNNEDTRQAKISISGNYILSGNEAPKEAKQKHIRKTVL